MSSDTIMFVVKRDGRKEEVSFDKILYRIRKLAEGLAHVNPTLVAQKVCSQIQNEITTSQLDEFAAETATTMSARNHPNYALLAARILVSNHQKNTSDDIACVAHLLDEAGIVSEEYYHSAFLSSHALNEMIDYSRDYLFDYFGFKTLLGGYLLKDKKGRVIERPQHMWMRVALQLHAVPKTPYDKIQSADFDSHDFGLTPESLALIKETYDALSLGYFLHATPTLFNSGTRHPQLSSCFLLQMDDDSIQGIYKTLGDCAQISKWAGGIGLNIHNIRARGSFIQGTAGRSTGIVPMLKVFNDTAKYVNQGGRRPGSFAIYLEPWHSDVEDFLRLKLNQGNEDERARDLFYALWIPDLFMKRVEDKGDWTLMCPHECPGLSDVWGPAFEELYCRYESEGKGRKTIPAQKLWQMILDAQIQTGTPYLLYKDAANSKSNQQNLGTIKSSNLCVAPETLVLTDKGQFPIKELAGQTVRVWNGERWSETTVVKTGENKKLLTIVVEDTMANEDRWHTWVETRYIRCTPYHKFIMVSDKRICDAPRKEASELKIGDELYSWAQDETNTTHSPRILSIYTDETSADTYCFNEPLNHAGVFNGILTGNCTEIIEYSSPEETAVCNLGSLSLPKFVNPDKTYNFEELRKYTKILIRNLDIVIDKNFYPTQETRRSNLRHRPVGLGVQGLADVFAKMRLPWTSEGASRLNREIFENMYYAAMEASIERAALGVYSSFAGSPLSQGKLQFDLWDDSPKYTPYLDWETLRRNAQTRGTRNSLLIAPMPTASTSQILGNNECFEPFTSNMYVRHVLAGDFIVINKYLVDDLMKLGLWTPEIRTDIIANNGSIQGVAAIPLEIRELYKTAWELPQKVILQMARDRAAFICQSQSLNLFVAEPTYAKISSMHFYAWKQGLKTGCYYLRTKAVASAQKFTIEPPTNCLTCSA